MTEFSFYGNVRRIPPHRDRARWGPRFWAGPAAGPRRLRMHRNSGVHVSRRGWTAPSQPNLNTWPALPDLPLAASAVAATYETHAVIHACMPIGLGSARVRLRFTLGVLFTGTGTCDATREPREKALLIAFVNPWNVPKLTRISESTCAQ